MSEYNGNTTLPASTVALLTRLTTTLTTATEQLRQVCAGAIVTEGEESQSAAKLQPYNSNTVSLIEEYNGNTFYEVPDTTPKQEPSEESQSLEACPRAYLRVRGQGQVEQGLKASVDPGKPQV